VARLPTFERGGSGESSDSNLLAIAGVGVAAIVGMLVLTGQGPFGSGAASEEPAPIPAATSGAAAGAAPAAKTTPAAKKTDRKAGASKKQSDAASGADQGEAKKPKGSGKKKADKAPAPATDGSGAGSVTDRYLDCMAKAQGKKEIDRCAQLVEGG
jgi:hypothetical protein